MSYVKWLRSIFRFCFFIRRFFLFFLSGRLRVMKRFLGDVKRHQPLLFLLSVHGPAGTAPNDSCGHSQETGAPNLQTGPLPAQVRFRARAVSNCFGRSFAWWGCEGGDQSLVIHLTSPTPDQPAAPGRCASATKPRPVAGRWPPPLFCGPPWWPWGCPAPAAIF